MVLVCGCGWVERFCCLSELMRYLWGRVGLGTLLGPEKTPWKRFFSVPPLILLSNASRLWVWWGCVWVGVWLCVECCIVDASILLWSSV